MTQGLYNLFPSLIDQNCTFPHQKMFMKDLLSVVGLPLGEGQHRDASDQETLMTAENEQNHLQQNTL